jgi:hypothetical protein
LMAIDMSAASTRPRPIADFGASLRCNSPGRSAPGWHEPSRDAAMENAQGRPCRVTASAKLSPASGLPLDGLARGAESAEALFDWQHTCGDAVSCHRHSPTTNQQAKSYFRHHLHQPLSNTLVLTSFSHGRRLGLFPMPHFLGGTRTRLAVLRTVGKSGPHDGRTRQSNVGLSARTETSL